MQQNQSVIAACCKIGAEVFFAFSGPAADCQLQVVARSGYPEFAAISFDITMKASTLLTALGKARIKIRAGVQPEGISKLQNVRPFAFKAAERH